MRKHRKRTETKMMDLVSLEQLASELGVSRSNARKIALRYGEKLGIVPVKRQVNGIGNRQRVLTWSRLEANQILKARQGDGYLLGGAT